MSIEDIKFDCKHFKGYMPCMPNKKYGAECLNCTYYTKISKRILIIKLGAIGDVIRTTPLVVRYKQIYPNAHITWITHFPNVLPDESIDKILKLDAVSIFTATNQVFDLAINLDKDDEACLLLKKVQAKIKYGFIYKDNHIALASPKAKEKLLTGLFDSISKLNTKSYLEEIFEICHLKFNYEEYLIKTNETLSQKWQVNIARKSKGKKVIGLNTGCGLRWKTRLLPKIYWIELIEKLQAEGYCCLLLGGAQEDAQNKIYAQKTQALYMGHFSLEEFISLVKSCQVIVSQVSLTMHITIALKKQLLLFNNIFNPHEFELYNRGIIVEPSSGCDCFYGNICKREKSCMYDIVIDKVVQYIKELANK